MYKSSLISSFVSCGRQTCFLSIPVLVSVLRHTLLCVKRLLVITEPGDKVSIILLALSDTVLFTHLLLH